MYHHRPLLIWSKGGRQPSRVDFRESIPQRGQFRHAPADMFLELPPFLSITPDEFRTGQSDGLAEAFDIAN
jgi:hypothetical protein